MRSHHDKSIYVLVTEDDQSLREFLASRLTDQGYKVMTADNGAEAVECVQNSKFHVVITDLHMPGMDGIQTLEAIKKLDPEVHVILASGYGDYETVAEAMKKGAYHFFHKPIAMTQLFQIIDKACEPGPKSAPGTKLEVLLETAMNRLQALFHADEGSFMLLDSNGCLYIACGKGLSEETVYSTMLMLGERVAGLAARQGRKFLITGGLDKHPLFSGIEERPRILSSIVVPVYCQDKLIGVVNLNRTITRPDFTDKELNGVSTFVSEMARDIQDVKLRADLETKDLKVKTSQTQSD